MARHPTARSRVYVKKCPAGLAIVRGRRAIHRVLRQQLYEDGGQLGDRMGVPSTCYVDCRCCGS